MLMITFTSVSAASLYWCVWLLTSNLWPSMCVCLCVLCVGLTWRYWLPQHWHTAKEPGDEKTDKPIKERWAAWLEQVWVSVWWVGGGVDGRSRLWATEWIGWGCVGRWKDCQRNVFLDLSCVVAMAVVFLTWTAAITAQRTFHPVVIINSA